MVNNTNAQKWLDEKYPIDDVCKRENDPENRNKKREEIITLDISKGKVGKNNLFSEEKNLIGSLKFEDFTNLQTLIVSSHQIIELDVSNCQNLEELYCQDNKLNVLNVNNCSNLTKINCSNNNLRELDLNTCTDLDEVDIKSCSKLTEDKIKSNLTYNAENGKLVRNSVKSGGPIITPAQESDIRNILIVGITGNGKSTLANVLTGTSKFEENSASTSVTKNFQKTEFEWELKDGKKLKYRIIDNIGFGDTSIVRDDILHEIGKGIHAAQEGINQVLFVFKDRFSEDQILAFNLFKDFINETGITKFTTLVKTGFVNFRSQEKCDEDRQGLLHQAKGLNEIINSCNDNGIIYVNNPAIPEIGENEDEETKKYNKNQKKVNERNRKKSREMILNHLAKNCSEIYKLSEWDSIVSMVNKYNEIEKSNSSTKEEDLKKVETKLVKKVDKTIKGNFGISVPNFPVNFNIGGEYTTHIEVPIQK